MLFNFNRFNLNESKQNKLDIQKLIDFVDDSIQHLVSEVKLSTSESVFKNMFVGGYDFVNFWADASAENASETGHYTIENNPDRGDNFSKERYMSVSVDFCFVNKVNDIFLKEINSVRHRMDMMNFITKMKGSRNGDKTVWRYKLKIICRKSDLVDL